MKVDQKINSMLMSFPFIKKIVKRFYQVINVILKKPKKYEGNIECVSPQDNFDYFFGYYDKSPWDISNRYMLCMKAKDTSKNVAPKNKLEILLIDTESNNKYKKIAESRAWNVQQGCMAQWLGPKYDKKIIYNDFRNDKFCSIILDVFNKKETVINMPVYSVSSNGKFGLTLDFSRLHRMRPGYGYSNIEDKTKGEKIPKSPCIWIVDLEKNIAKPYLYYEDFYNFEQRKDMINAKHKVNHIIISPNNDKFMVIHRWIVKNKKYSRLITCDIKTKKMYNLSDDNMVSHCYWKNNDEIIGFLNKKNVGNGYFLMKDKTKEFKRIWENISNDGHPSYSSDGQYVVTDSYPNKKRIQTLKIFTENEIFSIAKVFSPFKYDNNTRCDLHPRWSRNNNFISFDGSFDGNRRLYIINVSNIINRPSKKINILLKKEKIKILYMMTSCRKCGPTNQTLNIIKNLDRNIFEPYLLTIYEEEDNSMINDYLPYVIKHFTIITSKKQIFKNKTKKLDKFINTFNPDIVHTVGLFPNYYVSRKDKIKQITTLRNYVYEDYPLKYGKIIGTIMAKVQLRAIKNTTKVVACSKSLKEIYINKLGLDFDFIQNGIDIKNYKNISREEKEKLKKANGLEEFKKIFIYTGQFITRKNIPFLLSNFKQVFEKNKKIGLILLGDGPLLNELKKQYKDTKNIIFYGSSNQVNKYLSMSDYYVSTSLSEGLPNGALEALSSGLPVLLSDIEQHKELFMYNNIGQIYKSNNEDDFKMKIKKILDEDLIELSKNARKTAERYFSSKIMSKNYQKEYKKIVGR